MKYKVRIKNPIIGVPFTVVGVYNPECFEIVGQSNSTVDVPEYCQVSQLYVDGKRMYRRYFIRFNEGNKTRTQVTTKDE